MHPSVILLAALRKIHKDPAHNVGICNQVEWQFDLQTPQLRFAILDLLEELFIKWPKYSGLREFPVPATSPEHFGSPLNAYNCGTKNFWDRSTEYGALRWELLEFCIVQLENLNGD